jgi:hypothetical protein
VMMVVLGGTVGDECNGVVGNGAGSRNDGAGSGGVGAGSSRDSAGSDEGSAGSSRAGGEWSGSFSEGKSKDAGRMLWERAGSCCLRGTGSVGRQRWVVGKRRHGLGWYFEG